MWFTIIIIVIVFFFLKYVHDRGKLRNETLLAGGMQRKYAKLVSSFLVDANAKITLLTPTIIETTWTYGNIWIKHRIKQGFSNLISIEWETNMPLTTKNQLYWQFPEGMQQELIIDKMNHEIMVNLRYLKEDTGMDINELRSKKDKGLSYYDDF